MLTMRAALIDRYGPAEGLRIGEAPRPRPGAGELLVRVHATSVNPVDVKQRAGGQRAVVRHRWPAILGLDVSGVVEEIGPGVTRFGPGDAVFASPGVRRGGTWAEYALVGEREAASKPASVDHVGAAALPLVALTAWACVVDVGRVRAGQRALVLAGSGGVGTAAIQLLRHLGAEVTATCSAANAELVRSLGASRAIDYRSARPFDDLPPQDLVLDAIGPEHWRTSVGLARAGGVVASIAVGLPTHCARYGPALGLVRTFLGLVGGVAGARLRGRRLVPVLRPPDGERLARIGALVDAGGLRPVVERVLPLERIVEANQAVESGRTRGKVVVTLVGQGAGEDGALGR